MRPKSQFNKKIISRFSKGVKSQQKAKTLIRSGIPDAHRGILNIFYNNGGYKFSEVHPDLYNRHILNGEVLPSVNGTLSLLNLFSYP